MLNYRVVNKNGQTMARCKTLNDCVIRFDTFLDYAARFQFNTKYVNQWRIVTPDNIVSLDQARMALAIMKKAGK